MSSLYRLKPQFQLVLRPLAAWLAAAGVSANAVTLGEVAVSMLVGAVLALHADEPAFFLLLPAWLPLRMTANALDGMLARARPSASKLGVYLNELGDVISDAALYLPFARVPPFGEPSVVGVVMLAVIAEMAGALGPLVGGARRYDGPLGKSDRAVAFGALALAYALAGALPAWAFWAMPLLAAGLALTIVNRVRGGLA